MKILAIIISIFLFQGWIFANEIDSLKTNEDVQNFLIKIRPDWKGEDFFKKIETVDTTKYGYGKFFKLDLDNNGLTDLLINGSYLLSITDQGNNVYKTQLIIKGENLKPYHNITDIIYIDKAPLIIIEPAWRRNLSDKFYDTLILKYDTYHNYNSNPNNLEVTKINFFVSHCFGRCPVFKMSINSDRTAEFNALQYNEITGLHNTTLDSVSFNKLIQTINYIGLNSLKDDYSVDWTDDQTAYLEITFKNGKVKKITDYGLVGTRGLARLYDQFFILRGSQDWVKQK